jgi:hypothetical protein
MRFSFRFFGRIKNNLPCVNFFLDKGQNRCFYPGQKGKTTMDLKTQILKYLHDTGLKTYELEDRAGVPRATIYRYLSGKRGLMLSTAEILQEHMEKNPAQRAAS